MTQNVNVNPYMRHNMNTDIRQSLLNLFRGFMAISADQMTEALLMRNRFRMLAAHNAEDKDEKNQTQ